MSSTLWSKRHRPPYGRFRKRRPKTFSSAEAAHAWAKANGLSAYSLINLRTPSSQKKKIRIYAKDRL